jgi:hypothetical protein
VRFARRSLLLSLLTLVAGACGRSTPRAPAPRAALSAEFDRWNQEARGILSDGQETLRTFDVLQAFRVSTAAESSMRLGSELAWDPPTSATWDEATHVTRGLHGRAGQLFLDVANARIDQALWREQRDFTDAAHDLVSLGSALEAYRNRVDLLPPGDASNALGLLDAAWAQWDVAAARWGLSRAEPIPCGT